jgi:hypothetical protein
LVRGFIFAIILMIIGAAPALADVRIVSSLGGSVGSYLAFFSRVRQSGEPVIIDAMPFGLHTGVKHDSP